jgi:hypothetical protein
MRIKMDNHLDIVRDKNMSEEERQELQKCAKTIGEILHKDNKNREPKKLKTLEGIEIEVREQIQKYVSPEIGVFLLAQRQAQQVGEADR